MLDRRDRQMTIKKFLPWGSGKKSVPVQRSDEHPFMSLQRDVNTLFDNFFRGFGIHPLREQFNTFNPRVDMSEDEKAITVSAELPGMSEQDIAVSVSSDAITIRGETKQEKEQKGKSYHYTERSYGSFTRTIPIPEEIDRDKVQAHFKNAVLTITLPKTASAENTKKNSCQG